MLNKPDCDHKHGLELRGCSKQSNFLIFFYEADDKKQVKTTHLDKSVFTCRAHAGKLHKGLASLGAELRRRGNANLKLSVVDLDKKVEGVSWAECKGLEDFRTKLEAALTKRVSGSILGL